ncbi:uncharacterized protein LOC106168333 [Lingula anatina]|uniref:Uncharacterized protein LOC106168333 n=1 Tax=Lingula anatina TaxID=7574 RepID=A0A1S3IX87_LINAN|nr:uncharacterized protein LOC106168333 [Lingula anatina]|eukprot:XP_013402817.1 uncharacterized protein LOC106168333 [Lingula anatina]
MSGPVERWLETFMCKQYAPAFEAYGYRTLESVCQLSLSQLQSIGVTPDHCDKILENVSVLRQTLMAGKAPGTPAVDPVANPASSALISMSVNANRGTMNQYLDTSRPTYIPESNHLPYPQHGPAQMGPMGHQMHYPQPYQGQGQMMSPHHYSDQSSMYMPHSSQYPGQQSYPGFRAPFGSHPSMHHPGSADGMIPPSPMHHHLRGVSQQSLQTGPLQGGLQSGLQSPQQIADSIYHMASSGYSPEGSVPKYPGLGQGLGQSPMSRSPHYGAMMNSHPGGQSYRPTYSAYPGASPSMYSGRGSSPPGSIHAQSPAASLHSNHSIHSNSPGPNQSPSMIRSPLPSPSVVGMRSPTQGQPIRSPGHHSMRSPLHHPTPAVSSPATQHQMASPAPSGNISSPSQTNHYSPHGSLGSPAHTSATGPPHSYGNNSHSNTTSYSDLSTSSKSGSYPGSRESGQAANPLQSLQRLVMLPEARVVDPKSVVSDVSGNGGGEGGKIYDGPKNCVIGTGPSEEASPRYNNNRVSCMDGVHCETTSGQESSFGGKAQGSTDKVNRSDNVGSPECIPLKRTDFHHSSPYSIAENATASNSNCIGEENVQADKSAIEPQNHRYSQENHVTNGPTNNDTLKSSRESEPDKSKKKDQSPAPKGNSRKRQRFHSGSSHTSEGSLNADLMQENYKDLPGVECPAKPKRKYTKRKSGAKEQIINDESLTVHSSKNESEIKKDAGQIKASKSPKKRGKKLLNDSTVQNEQVEGKLSHSMGENGFLENIKNGKEVKNSKGKKNLDSIMIDSDDCLELKSPSKKGKGGRPRKSMDKPKTAKPKGRPRKSVGTPKGVKSNLVHDDSGGNIDVYEMNSDSELDISESVEPDFVPMFRVSGVVKTYERTPQSIYKPKVTSPDHWNSVTGDQATPVNPQIEMPKPNKKTKESTSKSKKAVKGKSSDSCEEALSAEKLKDSKKGLSESIHNVSLNNSAPALSDLPSSAKGAKKNGARKQKVKSSDLAANDSGKKKVRKKITHQVFSPETIEIPDVLSFEDEGEDREVSSSKNKYTKKQASKRPLDKINKVANNKFNDEKTLKDELEGDASLEFVELSKDNRDIGKQKRIRNPSSKKKSPGKKATSVEKPESIDQTVEPKVGENDSHAQTDVTSSQLDTAVRSTTEPMLDTSHPSTSQDSSFATPASTEPVKKRRGRPPGSKNSTPKKERLKKDIKKGRKKKGQEDVYDFNTDNEELKSLKLKRTFDMMSGKKKLNALSSHYQGPYIHLEGDPSHPTLCTVVNTPEDKLTAKSSKRQKTVAAVVNSEAVRTLTEKAAIIPSSVCAPTDWICALCGKGTHHDGLGDLYGPYYPEGAAPEEEPKPPKHRKRRDSNASVESKEMKRRKSISKDSIGYKDYWFHEDCITWCDGVYLLGNKVHGLEDVLSIAAHTMCIVCKQPGATLACFNKGCAQKYHYGCAVEKECHFDDDNFSIVCTKHKEKKVKMLGTPNPQTPDSLKAL